MNVKVQCPTCGKSIEWSKQARYRPFCSERCRLIDLGQWAAEDYRIASEEEASPHAARSRDADPD